MPKPNRFQATLFANYCCRDNLGFDTPEAIQQAIEDRDEVLLEEHRMFVWLWHELANVTNEWCAAGNGRVISHIDDTMACIISELEDLQTALMQLRPPPIKNNTDAAPDQG